MYTACTYNHSSCVFHLLCVCNIYNHSTAQLCVSIAARESPVLPRLSSTQFINTSNPLTHHRSRQTATDLKKCKIFLRIFLFRICRFISPVFARAERNWAIWMEMKKLETGRKVIEARFYVPISIFTATTRALWEYMNIHGDTMLYRANEQCGCVGCLFHSKMFPSSWLGHSACLGMQPKFLTCWSLIPFFNCFLWLQGWSWHYWRSIMVETLECEHHWRADALCFCICARRCPDRCWFVLAGATCKVWMGGYVICNVVCNVACKIQRQ